MFSIDSFHYVNSKNSSPLTNEKCPQRRHFS